MKFAIVTLVMFNNNYIPGAIALGNSARAFSLADTICMITPDVIKDEKDRILLENTFDKVIEVPYIDIISPTKTKSERYHNWLPKLCTKFQCLAFDTYDKVLFMDSDMIIVDHIDTIFTLPTPAGCFDHQMSKYQSSLPGYPANLSQQFKSKGNALADFYGPPKHGSIVNKNTIQLLKTNPNQFAVQGGFMLLTPNRFALECFKMKLPEINNILINMKQNTTSGIDELAITLFYSDMGYNWTHIDIRYNVSNLHLYSVYENEKSDISSKSKKDESSEESLISSDNTVSGIKVIHFLSQYKPWNESTDVIREKYPDQLKSHILWEEMYNNTYHVDKKVDLIDYLVEQLSLAIGPEAADVVPKFKLLYNQCFIHKSIDKVYNYELPEAFGDSFLKGTLGWIFAATPGITSPEELTTIIHNLQSKDTLEYVFDRLNLRPYFQFKEIKEGDKTNKPIPSEQGVAYTSKIKSDVVEALICAIGISWEKMYGTGEKAVLSFVVNTFTELRDVDPTNIQKMYRKPAAIAKEVLEKYFDISREENKFEESFAYISPLKIKYIIKLHGHILGTSITSIHKRSKTQYKTIGRDAAYMDMLDREAIQKYVKEKFSLK